MKDLDPAIPPQRKRGEGVTFYDLWRADHPRPEWTDPDYWTTARPVLEDE